jgi:hypothetical protein
VGGGREGGCPGPDDGERFRWVVNGSLTVHC